MALARHLFGGSIADFVVAPGGSVTVNGITGNETLLVPGTVIQFYDAPTAGNPVTDLEDLTFTAISTVTADTNGAIPQFYGPASGIRSMWADANAGAGPRRLMIATDIGSDLATDEAAIATLQASFAGLATVATSGHYVDLDETPNLATVATSGKYSDLTGTPSLGLQYVVGSGGTWPLRNTTASDTSRPAMWIGPAPSPPAGSGYALAGDLWVATPS